MYLLIAGGGKVGSNLARTLIRAGHEVTLIEQRPIRFDMLEAEFEHQVHKGDATELFVLERAGIKRPPDIVVAVTGKSRRIWALTISSTRRISSADSGLSWLKSKRVFSASTSEPFCST